MCCVVVKGRNCSWNSTIPCDLLSEATVPGRGAGKVVWVTPLVAQEVMLCAYKDTLPGPVGQAQTNFYCFKAMSCSK